MRSFAEMQDVKGMAKDFLGELERQYDWTTMENKVTYLLATGLDPKYKMKFFGDEAVEVFKKVVKNKAKSEDVGHFKLIRKEHDSSGSKSEVDIKTMTLFQVNLIKVDQSKDNNFTCHWAKS
jgi:hypothetical protein